MAVFNREEFMEGVRELRRTEYPKTHLGFTYNTLEEHEAAQRSFAEAMKPVDELESTGFRLPARGSVAIEAAYMTAFED